MKKIFGFLVVILLMVGVTTPAMAIEFDELPVSCVAVTAPDPVMFEKNVAKIGTIMATYKWFEESEGTWVLKIDVDPQGGENHRDWKTSYPQTWGLLFKKPVALPQTITEVSCETEEGTSSAGTPTDVTFAGSSTNAPGECVNNSIGAVGNIFVAQLVKNDTKVEVRWLPPVNADRAHIVYTEFGSPWHHALLNTENDGVQEIQDLVPGVQYSFTVAGVSGCAVGPWSPVFSQLP